MLAPTKKLFFKPNQPYREGKHKVPHKSEIKIDYLKLNILLFQLRLKGFDTDEGKIAYKLEAFLREQHSKNDIRLQILCCLIDITEAETRNIDLIKSIKSVLDGDFNDFDFRLLNFEDDKSLRGLFSLEQFGDISEMFAELGIRDQDLESDLKYLVLDANEDPGFTTACYDYGLNREFNFSLTNYESGKTFKRNTKAVKVLNKNALTLYLKNYFSRNRNKGKVTILDISKMGFANMAVSEDGQVVYGDPYMAEVTAIVQVLINRVLPRFGLSGVLARVGGDEFALHLTSNNGQNISHSQQNFVSNLLFKIVSKIEIIRANETGIIGLSKASFKDDKRPIFSIVDGPVAQMFVDLSSIPDYNFHTADEEAKEIQVSELCRLQLELKKILNTKITDTKTLGQIISEKATKLEIGDGPHISDKKLDLKLLDSFSGIRYQGLNTLRSGYLCFISIPFMKDVNDKYGSAAGDILKAKFEIAFFEEMAKLPEVVLNRISIHKKTPKIILRFDMEEISLQDFNTSEAFISNLSNINISIHTEDSSSQKEYPILFSQSRSTKTIDLRQRVDNLDEIAVIDWLKKIISKGYFLDIPVMNFLNSKNGARRTKNCLEALRAMSNQSTSLLRETIEFFDVLCAFAGEPESFNTYLSNLSAKLEKVEASHNANKAVGVPSTTSVTLGDFDIGNDIGLYPIREDSESGELSPEFLEVRGLTPSQCRLLRILNALLQFNRSNITIDGLADDPIGEFVELVSSGDNYQTIKLIYKTLLTNYLNKFLEISKTSSHLNEQQIYRGFIDLLKEFTKKQNVIFGDSHVPSSPYQSPKDEFNALVDIFCENFFKSLDYLKQVLAAVSDSDRLIYRDLADQLEI